MFITQLLFVQCGAEILRLKKGNGLFINFVITSGNIHFILLCIYSEHSLL